MNIARPVRQGWLPEFLREVMLCLAYPRGEAPPSQMTAVCVLSMGNSYRDQPRKCLAPTPHKRLAPARSCSRLAGLCSAGSCVLLDRKDRKTGGGQPGGVNSETFRATIRPVCQSFTAGQVNMCFLLLSWTAGQRSVWKVHISNSRGDRLWDGQRVPRKSSHPRPCVSRSTGSTGEIQMGGGKGLPYAQLRTQHDEKA